MNRPTKEQNYLNIAKEVSKRSTCTRRHYGAVIVKNDEIIATGYNGAPRGKPNCCDTGICYRIGHKHNDGDYSTCPAVHAEANAIISAARKDMIGATLYLYGEENGKVIDATPCPNCQGLIDNAGIVRVVESKRKPFTMYDRIKNMDVEQLAAFLSILKVQIFTVNEPHRFSVNSGIVKGNLEWLKTEIMEESENEDN